MKKKEEEERQKKLAENNAGLMGALRAAAKFKNHLLPGKKQSYFREHLLQEPPHRRVKTSRFSLAKMRFASVK